jgi:glucokinase
VSEKTPMSDLAATDDEEDRVDPVVADDTGLVVGIDVGGTKIALLATDVASGDDLAQDRFPTPVDVGPATFIEMLVALVQALVKTAGRSPRSLRAIGIAMPGQVDFDHGRVISAGNLEGWEDIPLRDIVSRALEVPVFVEQDANAAALGERWRGGARKMHNFVFLALGTGVGAGVVVNGRLHRGYHNAAGELGDMIMARSYLGKERVGHGNLERLVGGRGIRRTAQRITGEKLGTGEALARSEADPRLKPVAARVADFVAMAIIGISVVLDPEAVFIGGGTIAAGDWFIGEIRDRVRRELAHPPAIMQSVLGEDAQLHGAVFGALSELDPELALREELR